MKEWCVCSNKDGDLTVMHQIDRSFFILECAALEIPVTSFVVKRFDNRQEAGRYVASVIRGEMIIEDALKNNDL